MANATCDRCYQTTPRFVGASTKIILCRLHAQAGAAIDLLRRLVEGYDAAHEKAKTDDLAYFKVLCEVAITARLLLAVIDGAPAESEA